jgi:hypothetical protein
VAKTRPQLVCSDVPGERFALAVNFQERLHLLLQSWPSSVTLKIYEVSKCSRALARATRTLLAEVPLAIPEEVPDEHTELVPCGYDWASISNAALPVPLQQLEVSSVAGEVESGEQGNGTSKPLQVVAPAGAFLLTNNKYIFDILHIEAT